MDGISTTESGWVDGIFLSIGILGAVNPKFRLIGLHSRKSQKLVHNHRSAGRYFVLHERENSGEKMNSLVVQLKNSLENRIITNLYCPSTLPLRLFTQNPSPSVL